jgi:hypothetical protein
VGKKAEVAMVVEVGVVEAGYMEVTKEAVV